MVPEQTMNRNEKRVSIVLQIRQLLALYGIVVDRQVLIVHMHFCYPESSCSVVALVCQCCITILSFNL